MSSELILSDQTVEKDPGTNVNWSCKEVKAIIEVNKHGVKRTKEVKQD